eukprot:COSAG01_NODE_1570_length_9869_cov_360.007267_16_plen_182_part_00
MDLGVGVEEGAEVVHLELREGVVAGTFLRTPPMTGPLAIEVHAIPRPGVFLCALHAWVYDAVNVAVKLVNQALLKQPIERARMPCGPRCHQPRLERIDHPLAARVFDAHVSDRAGAVDVRRIQPVWHADLPCGVPLARAQAPCQVTMGGTPQPPSDREQAGSSSRRRGYGACCCGPAAAGV